jgi:hypothetical protein
MTNAHPGFKAVQSKIEREGYSAKVAGAILAKKTREASPAAKKANPRLKRVAGAKPKSASLGSNLMKGHA